MILLSNEDLWVNTSVLTRIGDPDAIGIIIKSDGTQFFIAAAKLSVPEAISVKEHMYDELPAECGQWLGLETPEQLYPHLPDRDHLLEIHGVQLNPHILLFDLEDGITRTFEEVFGDMEYAIVPPKGEICFDGNEETSS